MRAITGLSEDTDPGQSNPKIEGMAAYVGRTFPPQASYASNYTSDDTAWCGVTEAFCMSACKPPISGPFGATDTDKWMWAQSWASDPGYVKLASPVRGAIVVFRHSDGSGHVTTFEEWNGNSIDCRGGNQSNCVKVSTYSTSEVLGYYWPKDYPMPDVPPAPREDVSEGDSGPSVVEVQTILGIVPADGDFGPITDGGVKGYQAACGLVVDGEVGPQTWSKLDELQTKVTNSEEPLSAELVSAITDTAQNSSIARYAWKDRGKAPTGYIAGMALCFAVALDRLNSEDDAAQEMSRPNSNDPDTDVFAYYESEFDDEGMSNDESNSEPVERLRHLFALMIGLGMRESSGRYCEGRDMSADNVSSDTAEAGMFQTSWNIRSCNSAIPPLLTEFWSHPVGYRESFQDGVSPDSNDLGNYGSGGGAQSQFLSKYAALFHALVGAVGPRNLRAHWGPINRYEAELKSEADSMLQAVQHLVESGVEPGPDPEPEHPNWVNVKARGKVQVQYGGDVYVTVNGEPLQG